MGINKQEYKRREHLANALAGLGFNADEIEQLRRISNTLQRWFELECGTERGGIVRDEETGIPYWFNSYTGKRSYRVADRESGAMKRLHKIMANHLTLSSYIQGDCRGAVLYIIRPNDIPAGESIDSCYNRGICVY